MDRELIDNLIDRINDKIFKIVFQNKESAIEYLETFLSDIAQSLDLEFAKKHSTKFIEVYPAIVISFAEYSTFAE